MSFLQLSESRPNKHTDRAHWNASWENDLKIWQTFEHTPPSLYIQDPRIYAYGIKTESVFRRDLEHIERDIVRLQSDLHHKTVIRMATRNFAEEWTALSTSARETHLLEALYKVSTTGPDMEGYRKWCPELTVQPFAQDGQRYVDLLESFVKSATATVEDKKTVTFFPHPVVSKIFAMVEDIQGSTTALKMRLDRAFFMTMFLWRTLLSFCGEDEISRFDSSMMAKDKNTKKFLRDALKQSFPVAEERNAYNRRLRELKLLEKARGETRYCWGCGTSESLLPTGTQLRACAECKKGGRATMYCSKECQKTDWKNGLPQPHKFSCGKPFKDDPSYSGNAPVVSKPKFKKIPHPDPSFTRSSALCYQILKLEREDNPDYVLVPPAPLPDIGIHIPGSVVQRCHFLLLRQRALRTGDPAAVKGMVPVLQLFAKKFAPPNYSLKRQLQAEYGVDIDAIGEFEPIHHDGAEREAVVDLVLSFGGKLEIK